MAPGASAPGVADESAEERREAEAKNPKLLWLTEKDIAAGDAELEADRFPDHLTAGPLVVQLRYRFEPGHEDDGVSALIPLHVLNQVPEEPFVWLAPGFLEEKVTALVRSLPKQLRVNFVPVPDAVAKVMPLLDGGRGSLYAQLADALSRGEAQGTEVERAARDLAGDHPGGRQVLGRDGREGEYRGILQRERCAGGVAHAPDRVERVGGIRNTDGKTLKDLL